MYIVWKLKISSIGRGSNEKKKLINMLYNTHLFNFESDELSSDA